MTTPVNAAPHRKKEAHEVKREVKRETKPKEAAREHNRTPTERARERVTAPKPRDHRNRPSLTAGREQRPTVAHGQAHFASRKHLESHYQKHRNELGARSAAHYDKMASRFMSGTPQQGVLQGTRSNGEVVRYNPRTREFGVIKSNGTIKTYYKLEPKRNGMAYYQREWRK